MVEGSKHRRGIKVYARRGAPVVAVNDGKIIRVGESERLGRFVQFQDVYGNTYTYAHLAKVAKTYPAPARAETTRKAVAKELALPAEDAKPTAPASATTVRATKRAYARRPQAARRTAPRPGRHQAAPVRAPGPPQGRPSRR